MHKLILASCAGSSLVVTITIIVDTSAQVSSFVHPQSSRPREFLSLVCGACLTRVGLVLTLLNP